MSILLAYTLLPLVHTVLPDVLPSCQPLSFSTFCRSVGINKKNISSHSLYSYVYFTTCTNACVGGWNQHCYFSSKWINKSVRIVHLLVCRKRICLGFRFWLRWWFYFRLHFLLILFLFLYTILSFYAFQQNSNFFVMERKGKILQKKGIHFIYIHITFLLKRVNVNLLIYDFIFVEFSIVFFLSYVNK